ncbi:phage holin, partial [Bacillus atrophaeus]|uniref:phage holin n=1 Tax=Bacillus atrophaeus TaxID=1452 RepID=UPI001EFBBBC0
MKNFDKGTVVRTVLLFIALVNQTLIMLGKPVLPISEDQVNTLADALYLADSTAFTIITTG